MTFLYGEPPLATSSLSGGGYLLLAPLAAVVAGFIITAIRCAVVGGRHGGNVVSLAAEWRCLLLIALLDAIGGLAVAISVWFVSPIRSRTLLDVNKQYPALFWLILGCSGPLVISGLLRWLPPKSRVNTGLFADEQGFAQLVQFRKELTSYLYEIMAQNADAWTNRRSDWLVVLVTKKVSDGELTPQELDRNVARVAQRSRSRKLPPKWADFKSDRTFSSSDPLVFRDLVLRMASLAIDHGFEHAVASSIRIRITEFNKQTPEQVTHLPQSHTNGSDEVFVELDDMELEDEEH